MGSINENGDQFDVSDQGRTLTYNGEQNSVQYGYRDLAPYVDFAGGDLYRADEAGLDILGTEAYVLAAYRGLSIGLWFRPDRLTNSEMLIGKSTTAPATSSYWLIFRGDLANDPIQFSVSDGAATTSVNLNSVVTVAGEWYFAAGRFDPSTEIKVWGGYNGTLQTNTNLVGVPAALGNNASQLTVGASHNGAGFLLDGAVSMAWLSCMYLSDAQVRTVWEQTRAMFGG